MYDHILFSCTTIYPLIVHLAYFTLYQAVADKFSFSGLYILHIFEIFDVANLHIFEAFLSFLRYYQHMAFVAQCGGEDIGFSTILQLQSLAQFCYGKGEVAGGDVRLGDS